MNLPQHIAIIMDGNGRWARKRGLPRTFGHRAGIEAVKKIIKTCDEAGIKILTVYAFSTENWNRPKREIKFLMNYLKDFLVKYRDEFAKNKIRLTTIGQSERLPASVRKELDKTIRLTKDNQGLRFNLALSYGGRTEIVEAVKRLIKEFRDRKYSPEQIKESLFAKYLYTKDLPDPDLLIRTGGEMRISNFLLWQISYTEIYFTDKFWPDFGKQDLMRAIAEYGRRTRRFGHVN